MLQRGKLGTVGVAKRHSGEAKGDSFNERVIHM